MKTLLIALFFLAANVMAADISCRVISVSDGDTLTCLNGNFRQLKVRLAQIDAPEKNQPFGQRSKQALALMVFGRQVTLQPETIDKYDRTVARVLHDGTDVNLAQVRNGLAWVYRQYAQDQTYFSAEAQARSTASGLWSDPSPIAPWDWRHKKKTGAPTAPPRTPPIANTAPQDNTSFSCGSKTRCNQMRSCDEARFYLNQCRVTQIDGNKDGTPCESLCR